MIGDLEMLPKSTSTGLQKGIDLTKKNRTKLSLALNYGSRHEIIQAT